MSKIKLSSIAQIVNGATPSTKHPEYYDGDIIWATPKDLADQKKKYFEKGERTISKEGYDSCSTEMIPAGNILMSSRAPIGLLSINTVDCCTNQGFKSLILDADKCDANYIYYYLIYHIKEIEALGSGTTFKEVSKTSLENYEVDIPSKENQIRIASILNNIDEKIANNDAISAQLESLAKTIYDYWFLQFEFPNEDGKPYKSSGGKMVWNEELKREIPERWKVIHLSDIATIKTDDINPMDNPTLEYIHYSIPAFDETHFPVKELGESINSGKYIVPENAILVSKLNPQFKRIWDPVECGDNCICSTEFMPFVPKDKYRGYLYSVLNSDPFQQYMIACSSSSTGSRKRMQPELCDSFPFASPQNEDPIIAKMSSLISGILMTNRKIAIETKQLTSLRDFLLPLLMNGQVTFKDEAASEEE